MIKYFHNLSVKSIGFEYLIKIFTVPLTLLTSVIILENHDIETYGEYIRFAIYVEIANLFIIAGQDAERILKHNNQQKLDNEEYIRSFIILISISCLSYFILEAHSIFIVAILIKYLTSYSLTNLKMKRKYLYFTAFENSWVPFLFVSVYYLPEVHIVYLYISSIFLQCVILQLFHPIKITLPIRFSFYGFNYGRLFNRVLEKLIRKLDSILFDATLGSASVGLYDLIKKSTQPAKIASEQIQLRNFSEQKLEKDQEKLISIYNKYAVHQIVIPLIIIVIIYFFLIYTPSNIKDIEMIKVIEQNLAAFQLVSVSLLLDASTGPSGIYLLAFRKNLLLFSIYILSALAFIPFIFASEQFNQILKVIIGIFTLSQVLKIFGLYFILKFHVMSKMRTFVSLVYLTYLGSLLI